MEWIGCHLNWGGPLLSTGRTDWFLPPLGKLISHLLFGSQQSIDRAFSSSLGTYSGNSYCAFLQAIKRLQLSSQCLRRRHLGPVTSTPAFTDWKSSNALSEYHSANYFFRSQGWSEARSMNAFEPLQRRIDRSATY